MPLVRAWTRGLSGASGAAVLVPGGVFAALLLLALAGSFGRIGGLGQALSGPAAPGLTQRANVATPGSARHGPALLPVVLTPTAAAASNRLAGHAAARGAGIANGSSAARPGGSPSGGGATQPAAPVTPGAPSGPGGCSSCTQPSPHQTLVDQVVSIGTTVTNKLPAVGQLTTNLLKQVGATVDKILPSDRQANVVPQVGGTLSQLKLP